jgi:uncharacterized delta-60 repeat protein
MKSKTANIIPLIATSIVPAATLTSALAPPPALGGTGDLDPGFGDVGRLGSILNGPAWSLKPLADGTMLLAGGTLWFPYYYYYVYVSNFVKRVTDVGVEDPSFAPTGLDDIQVFDIIRQSDGPVIGVGRNVNLSSDSSQFAVFRLQTDGPLDESFGTDGIFTLPVPPRDYWDAGTSVVLDPDGRIVVAGSQAGRLVVVRLLPDGSIDSSFGTLGAFTGAEVNDPPSAAPGARTRIVRTAAGGYRVTASGDAGCQVIALTAVGTIDATFGAAGVATVDTPVGPSTHCTAMVSQPDGHLLVAGRADGQGFAARILDSGQQDTGFSAAAVSSAMAQATAVAAGNDGSVVVAGTGVSGASIMRLQADGELDALFGRAGTTLVDFSSDFGLAPAVNDMFVRADGSVVAAGGDATGRAFVARLLGTGGGQSPGVLGIAEQSRVSTAEGGVDVAVHVRRTGGADGSASVAYRTASDSAEAGQDFGAVSGLLTWGDGDVADQEIRVPITSDNSVEEPETFRVILSDSQGGAGLGTAGVTVVIAADGGPYGQFRLFTASQFYAEPGPAEMRVVREYYSSGAVSVTLTPTAGTATAGADFSADPITLTWADGESGVKFARIQLIDDMDAESFEDFTVHLSNATGGAVIGPHSSLRSGILANDQPPANVAGGGGAFGFLSLLLLGLLKTMRWLAGGKSMIKRS